MKYINGGKNMQQMIVLGTGNATVKKCYNTCFALKQENEYVLVDAGGGNGILKQLEDSQIALHQIHHLFVSHEHTDHVLGVVWMVRMIATHILNDKYKDNFHLYAHNELVESIKTLCTLTLPSKLIKLFDQRIIFHRLEDNDHISILNHSFTFFDILSTKAKQFGFTFINEDNKKITFAGDEPYNKECFKYVQGSHWLLHEAFCLYSEKEIFKPYEKHHSTSKDAAILARELGVEHLVLWHTEETHLKERKTLYTLEAQKEFDGHIYVPNDLEKIDLCQ